MGIFRRDDRRSTLPRITSLSLIDERVAALAPALRDARQDLDATSAVLAERLTHISEYVGALPATAAEVLTQLRGPEWAVAPHHRTGSLHVEPAAAATLASRRTASLAESVDRFGRSRTPSPSPGAGDDPRFPRTTAASPTGRSSAPRNGGRMTLPEAERSLNGEVNSSFFTSDVHNKVRKVALYQAWLGETWASSSIDAIASRIISGGWLLDPVDKDRPNQKTKYWVQDFFDWCNVDEEMHGIIHSSLTDLGWAGECYLEVTWRYNRTLRRDIPYELFTVDPISMEYVTSPDKKRIDGYKQVNDTGQPIALKPRQIVRVWFPDPRNRWKALSPLEKLLNPLVLDMYLQASEQTYFKQGNRGDLAILAKRADRTSAIKLIDFIEEHALGLKNAHRPLVLYADNDDVELHPLPGRDTMNVPERRDGVRKEVSAGLHVPPHQLGIIEGGSVGGQGATYVMEKQFVHTGTDPYKLRYLHSLNFSLVNVGFGVSDWVLNTNYADMRDDADILKIETETINAGLTTINAIRAKKKEDPTLGGDVPFIIVGSDLIPVSHIPQLAAAPPSALQSKDDPTARRGAAPPGSAKGTANGGAVKDGTSSSKNAFGTPRSGGNPSGDNERDSDGRPVKTPTSGSGVSESSANPTSGSKSSNDRGYWCVLATLPGATRTYVETLRRLIPDSDLSSPYVDPDVPHVTLLYGVHSVDDRTLTVLRHAASALPVTAHLGALSVFPTPSYDVLHLAVDGVDLFALRAILERFIPNTQSHPSFHPHATVAYLKPGAGQRYLAASGPTIRRPFTLDALFLSPPGSSISHPSPESLEFRSTDLHHPGRTA